MKAATFMPASNKNLLPVVKTPPIASPPVAEPMLSKASAISEEEEFDSISVSSRSHGSRSSPSQQ